jgi:putative hydrolase of the HAD superfamily
MSPLAQLMSKNALPMAPQPADISPSLKKLDGVRHLVWDLYGTLLISTAGAQHNTSLHETILRSLLSGSGELPRFSLSVHFQNLIAQDQAHSRKSGIDFPEVDILKIWSRFFKSLDLSPHSNVEEFALRFELMTNPYRPFPGAKRALSHPATTGLISNAQFYTPLLLEAFSLPVPELTFYSYQNRQAKPGTFLFREFLKDGPPPEETLYIGNDLLNDVAPAHRIGMRTALFAGDTRSFRPRPGRLDLPRPDVVLTSLEQIEQLLPE